LRKFETGEALVLALRTEVLVRTGDGDVFNMVLLLV